MAKPNFQHFGEIKKKLSSLNDQRTQHIFSLVHGKSLIHGLPQTVYKKCGKKRCKCVNTPHGPYPALSINKNGRQKTVLLKKSDMPHILKKAKRYRHFQQTLASIRKINKEIDYLLQVIKISTSSEYPHR
jgi:hypothetical protein